MTTSPRTIVALLIIAIIYPIDLFGILLYDAPLQWMGQGDPFVNTLLVNILLFVVPISFGAGLYVARLAGAPVSWLAIMLFSMWIGFVGLLFAFLFDFC